jgi:hypothetical protein
MSAQGIALKKITATLNVEKLPSAATSSRKVSELVSNNRNSRNASRELYVVRVIGSKSKFVNAPGRNKRLCRMRPESECRLIEQPYLGIISEEL